MRKGGLKTIGRERGWKGRGRGGAGTSLLRMVSPRFVVHSQRQGSPCSRTCLRSLKTSFERPPPCFQGLSAQGELCAGTESCSPASLQDEFPYSRGVACTTPTRDYRHWAELKGYATDLEFLPFETEGTVYFRTEMLATTLLQRATLLRQLVNPHSQPGIGCWTLETTCRRSALSRR